MIRSKILNPEWFYDELINVKSDMQLFIQEIHGALLKKEQKMNVDLKDIDKI